MCEHLEASAFAPLTGTASLHLEAVTAHLEPAAWLPGTASLLLGTAARHLGSVASHLEPAAWERLVGLGVSASAFRMAVGVGLGGLVPDLVGLRGWGLATVGGVSGTSSWRNRASRIGSSGKETTRVSAERPPGREHWPAAVDTARRTEARCDMRVGGFEPPPTGFLVQCLFHLDHTRKILAHV